MSTGKPLAERGPDVIAPPPLIFAGPLLAGLALDRLVRLPRLPRAVRMLGVPMLGAGAAMAAWFITTMRSAGTPVDVRQPPTTLVDGGPFEYTRNPGYLGLTLAYVGISVLAGGRWPLLFLPGVLVGVNRGVVEREEQYLQERFGSRYIEYCSRVPRWL